MDTDELLSELTDSLKPQGELRPLCLQAAATIDRITAEREALDLKLEDACLANLHNEKEVQRLTAERDGLRAALERIASPNELVTDPSTFGEFPERYLYFAQETARRALATSPVTDADGASGRG